MWDNSVSHKLLIKLIEKDTEIFTTTEILEEYKKVLLRDFKCNGEEAQNIINKLLSFIKIIEPIEKISVVKEDLSDNKIIECALSSDSGFIISCDNHLLKLKEFRGIKIIAPEEFLENFH